MQTKKDKYRMDQVLYTPVFRVDHSPGIFKVSVKSIAKDKYPFNKVERIMFYTVLFEDIEEWYGTDEDLRSIKQDMFTYAYYNNVEERDLFTSKQEAQFILSLSRV